ncbi:MAG: hypothetical protein DWQ21_09845 [Bacteroidetes bacterium]|nr:MAG: hypothetical protein DWQ21_09845 [Bacteroidota bacterium]REK51975.1 MAG: hypothetical protein DWQ49_13780 [Bacteroidota bacterium]
MPLDFGDLSSYYNKNIDYDAGISPGDFKYFKPKGGSSSFFNYGQSGSTEKKGGLEQFGNLAKQQLEKSEKRRERDEMIAAYSRMAAQPFGGAGLAGRQFTLGDGSLTQINPDTFEPIVIPAGGAGVAGGRSTGQRLAGAATGALGGAAAGAKFGSVLGLPGAAVGAVIGGLGGLFG